MISLTDIGALTKKVDVLGTTIGVSGVSADGIVQLMDRFPEIRKAMGGGGSLGVDEVIKLVPRAVGAIIHFGTDGAIAEDVARKLPAGLQLSLVKEIFSVTFPLGIERFVEDMAALGLGAPAPAPVHAGNGKDPVTTLPPPSPASSVSVESPKKPPGK